MFGLMRARTCVKNTEGWRTWRNHYCGTCKTIGARYGQAPRMALNHDTVFLAELLSALSPNPDAGKSKAYRSFNCMTLPKSDAEIPAVLRYAAAATVMLAEFKIIDHIEDTGRRRWRSLARVFSSAFRSAENDLAALSFPVAKLRDVLRTQQRREREGTTLADFYAPTAGATALFFAHGAVVAGIPNSVVLGRLGRQFGELAYLMDAYEDYGRDRANGAFNAIRAAYRQPAAEELNVEVRREVVSLLRDLARAIQADLETLPLQPHIAAGFATRLNANLDAKLGLHVCRPMKQRPVSRKQRWQEALAFAQRISIDSPRWRASATVAGVALMAYLLPSHSRAAATPAECFSLGFNLMAIGSVFAMAAGGGAPVGPGPIGPPPAPGPAPVATGRKVSSKAGCGSCCDCGVCDSDCCGCTCLSCEACSCCGESCGACGSCGECCGSCSCDC